MKSTINEEMISYEEVFLFKENSMLHGEISDFSFFPNGDLAIITKNPNHLVIIDSLGFQKKIFLPDESVGYDSYEPLKVDVTEQNIVTYDKKSLKFYFFDFNYKLTRIVSFGYALNTFQVQDEYIVCYRKSVPFNEESVVIYDYLNNKFIDRIGRFENQHNVLDIFTGYDNLSVDDDLVYFSSSSSLEFTKYSIRTGEISKTTISSDGLGFNNRDLTEAEAKEIIYPFGEELDDYYFNNARVFSLKMIGEWYLVSYISGTSSKTDRGTYIRDDRYINFLFMDRENPMAYKHIKLHHAPGLFLRFAVHNNELYAITQSINSASSEYSHSLVKFGFEFF